MVKIVKHFLCSRLEEEFLIEKQFLYFAAIDFGTHGTTFSVGHKVNDKILVETPSQVDQWGQDTANSKTSTSVLVSGNGKLLAFGDKALKDYTFFLFFFFHKTFCLTLTEKSVMYEEILKKDQNVKLFKQFKMSLYNTANSVLICEISCCGSFYFYGGRKTKRFRHRVVNEY